MFTVSSDSIIQGAPDILFGWAEVDGSHYYVRQLRDMKGGPNDGAVLIPVPLDYLPWMERVATFVRRPDLRAKVRTVWLTGSASPMAKRELTALGWTVARRAARALTVERHRKPRSAERARLPSGMRAEAVLHGAGRHESLHQCRREGHVGCKRRLMAQEAITGKIEPQGRCGNRVESTERPVLAAEAGLRLGHHVQRVLVLAANQVALRCRLESRGLGLGSRPSARALWTSSASRTPIGNSCSRGFRWSASIASRDANRSLEKPSARSTTAYFTRRVW